jgi:hypothetical protein
MPLPIDIVRNYNQALFGDLANGTTGSINEYLTEATTCVESPALPWGGTWVGPEGFAQMFATPGDGFEMAGGLEESFWADGSTVFHRMSFDIAKKSGEKSSVASLELYEVEDEKISSIEVFFFDPNVFAA